MTVAIGRSFYSDLPIMEGYLLCGVSRRRPDADFIALSIDRAVEVSLSTQQALSFTAQTRFIDIDK